MSDAVGVKRPATWNAPAVKPLDEDVWQSWIGRGRARDSQGRETRIKALQWGAIVGLLAVAGLWSQLVSYDIVIRCVLVLGAVFAALAQLYNPVASVFSFSGNWQRALVIATAIPFVTSLAWRDLKAAPIE